MEIRVQFFSYYRDLTGCAQASIEVPESSRLGDLTQQIHQQFPKLAGTEKSTLVAVGVEYQDREYVLAEGDEVSLFPPVQGG
ncbi:MAG: MoaD family protein [Limisphaerales bacterium]|jgi:molybdopterin synthase catalytic subunit